MKKVILTEYNTRQLAKKVARNMTRLFDDKLAKLTEHYSDQMPQGVEYPYLFTVFGIPRGGIPAAYMVVEEFNKLGAPYMASVTYTPEDADLFIDDIIDSGETMKVWCDAYPGIPFFALIDKTAERAQEGEVSEWLVFPWEQNPLNPLKENSLTDNVVRILQYIGEDPTREGLQETPERFQRALDEWFSGYNEAPVDYFKVFTDGAARYDEMVLVENIPFYSHCEHHLAPFFGTVTIAYIPDGKIVGLSKFNRLVNTFSRRLQVQERLTTMIADTLMDFLSPKGVGVIVKARHLCMESRGVCQQGHSTTTSCMRGVMLNNGPARAEFLTIAKK